MRRIVAMGGGGFSMEPDNPLLDDYLLGLTGKERARVCFVPTASGDSSDYIMRFYEAFALRSDACHLALFKRTVGDLERFVLDQDVIYVGGGSVVNLLAVWRSHGLDRILHRAWERGVILAGISAGSLCWFESGVTDSYGALAELGGGLGLLRGSSCPHYDGEAARRLTYHRLVASIIGPGYAADDGAALLFEGEELAEVVTSRPYAHAYRVEPDGAGGVRETMLSARYLG